MKKLHFLLLDAGPIIKLFELEIWEQFIKACDVTIARTVAEDEVIFACKGADKKYIDLMRYEKDGQIQIVEVESSVVKTFYDCFDSLYRDIIDPGERETLAFLHVSPESWRLCAADHAVFRVLGLLGKGERDISLEEVLSEIGLGRDLKWQYSKKFRQKYTRMGQSDSIQGKGLQ